MSSEFIAEVRISGIRKNLKKYSDTALAVGLAFCSRKICLEDRKQKAWTEIALLHVEKAFAHLQRENRFHRWQVPLECKGQGIDKIQVNIF